MPTEQFQVLNVKCAGCAANIKNGVGELNGVTQVEVKIDSGSVTVQGERLDRGQIRTKLAALGYPEV